MSSFLAPKTSSEVGGEAATVDDGSDEEAGVAALRGIETLKRRRVWKIDVEVVRRGMGLRKGERRREG